DERAWLIRNRGALETVRFDDAAGLAVDFARSSGVVGERHKGNALYVMLDGARAEAQVTLMPATTVLEGPPLPYLVESRWTLRDFNRRDCGFAATAQGFGPGQMTWGGLAPGAYRISVRRSDAVLWQGSAQVDGSRQLSVTVGAEALEPVAIDVACAAAGDQP